MNMNRNTIMTLVTSLVLFSIPFASTKFVKLLCKDEHNSLVGQQSLLECNVKAENNDTTITGICWKRKTTENEQQCLLDYNEGNTSLTPGFTFAEPDWNNRNLNVSLLLTNTKMEDKGEYECVVRTDRGHAEATVSLSVTVSINLDCKNEYHGVHGKQVLLECIVKPVNGVDINILAVKWKIKGNVTLLEYKKPNTSAIPGFTFAEPDWNNINLNVSLLLTNTTMEDEGEYECELETDLGTAKIRVNLSVTGSKIADSTKDNSPSITNRALQATGSKAVHLSINESH
ncbi:hypothetical protein UPYG_G00065900 [Umbra pygmaea]|uniref:Ig-like domain-containing protein n=1 Tax=Umbra pygmaea TaxID=75934 RepID=A0ABD0XZV8_UMBPY